MWLIFIMIELNIGEENNMTVLTDDEYLIVEPCASCEKSYTEDIWWEWCCDAKKCIHKEEYDAVSLIPPEKRSE